MNNYFLKNFCIGTLMLTLHNLNAQETVQENKHSLNIELAGRTAIISSLNYENALNKKFSIGAGLGLGVVNTGEISRSNNGVSENGKYRDITSSQMIYGNYFFGVKKNRLFLTAGVTNFLSTSRNKYPSETERFGDADAEWSAGVGYQFNKNDKYFRITAYTLSLPVDANNGILPKFLPWLGFTGGINILKK